MLLYCIVLYCIVLYCIVLYCIVLYCIVLYCIVLYTICDVCFAVASCSTCPNIRPGDREKTSDVNNWTEEGLDSERKKRTRTKKRAYT